MECVLACGLIALVLPVVAMVLGHGASSAQDARMEAEAQRSIRRHALQWMDPATAPASDAAVWAHAACGDCLGRIGEEPYTRGVDFHRGQKVSYLAVAETLEEITDGDRPLIRLSLRLEYPAAAPASRRSRIELHAATRP